MESEVEDIPGVQIMAASHRESVKNLTRTRIRAVSLQRKALSREDVFERVRSVASGTYSEYFECSSGDEVEVLELSARFLALLKHYSDSFFISLPGKFKGDFTGML